MNELSTAFQNVSNGDTVYLEKEKVYAISPKDSFYKTGLFFSNTAARDEQPKGERFCGIYLENKQDITVDGQGSTVMIHGMMTPFILVNCKNVVIKNLKVDHFRPTMSEFTVLESQEGQATIEIYPEFLHEIRENTLFWQAEKSEDGTPYWEIPYKGEKVLSNTFHPDVGVIDDMICGTGDKRGGVPDIIKILPLEENCYRIYFRDTRKIIPKGTVVQTRSIRRLQTGGALLDCENIVLENLRIQSMNGFGILAQNSKNLTYRNLDCTPKDGRVIVSDADFFHFSGCSGEIKILDCKAEGAHDDIINVHGTHLKVVKVDKKRKRITVRYMHKESWGFTPYECGEKIEFVNGKTLQAFATATVTSVEKLNDTDYLLSVDNCPSRFYHNTVIENITKTASVLVQGNRFGRIPSRGILCTTRKEAVIRDNTFYCMGGPVLCVADDANFWFESGKSGTIIFENNTIIDCSLRECEQGCDVIRYEPVVMDKRIQKPVHEKLIVRNNRFSNSRHDGYTLHLKFLHQAEITGNQSDGTLVLFYDRGIESSGVIRSGNDPSLIEKDL